MPICSGIEFKMIEHELKEEQRFEAKATVLLPTSLEDVSTSITAGSKIVVVAIGTIQLVVAGWEGLIHEAVGAVHTHETFLMPVLVLIWQVLQQWVSKWVSETFLMPELVHMLQALQQCVSKWVSETFLMPVLVLIWQVPQQWVSEWVKHFWCQSLSLHGRSYNTEWMKHFSGQIRQILQQWVSETFLWSVLGLAQKVQQQWASKLIIKRVKCFLHHSLCRGFHKIPERRVCGAAYMYLWVCACEWINFRLKAKIFALGEW